MVNDSHVTFDTDGLVMERLLYPTCSMSKLYQMRSVVICRLRLKLASVGITTTLGMKNRLSSDNHGLLYVVFGDNTFQRRRVL